MEHFSLLIQPIIIYAIENTEVMNVDHSEVP